MKEFTKEQVTELAELGFKQNVEGMFWRDPGLVLWIGPEPNSPPSYQGKICFFDHRVGLKDGIYSFYGPIKAEKMFVLKSQNFLTYSEFLEFVKTVPLITLDDVDKAKPVHYMIQSGQLAWSIE